MNEITKMLFDLLTDKIKTRTRPKNNDVPQQEKDGQLQKISDQQLNNCVHAIIETSTLIRESIDELEGLFVSNLEEHKNAWLITASQENKIELTATQRIHANNNVDSNKAWSQENHTLASCAASHQDPALFA